MTEMETEVASAGAFAPAVTEEEWREVPADVGKKLQSFVEGRFDELLTTKALLETYKYNTEQNLSELKTQYETAIKERDELQIKFTASNNTITNLENEVSTAITEVTKLQNTCSRLEQETAQFRNQRNLAMDERDSLQRMVERRDGELQRLQEEMEQLKGQLEAAISAKCQLLAQADEVESMKLTIEYKQKRWEQERSLLTEQMESLNQDLHQKTDELLNMRRDNSVRCIQLETKLTEKLQELANANEHIKSLTDLNSKLEQRTDELSAKLNQQKELYAKTTESFNNELQAQTKLVELHKKNCEEHAEHIKKLTAAIEELQEKLKIASEKYGDLETEHKEEVLRNQELLEKKDECIALLKRELDVANDLLESTKQDSLNKHIEELAPGAAAASNMLKSGMSLTGIYNKYMEVAEELATERAESARMKAHVTELIQDLQVKAPFLRKQREDMENAFETIAELVKKNDDLVAEIQDLRETMSECRRSEGVATRENARLKKELADLGRQVCHLLREIEQLRNGSSSISTDQDMSDSLSSADIITKRLVTFSDMAELQSNNQRLLALVRELSERQEEAESYDPVVIAKLRTEIESLREQQRDNLEQLDKQNKMMATVMNQRDMYKTLYGQAVKGSKSDSSMEDQDGEGSSKDGPNQVRDEKLQELESQVQKYRKDFEFLKEENETYRKEKSDNEKILLEQVENMRKEHIELVRVNGKLSIQVSTLEDRCQKLLKEIDFQKSRVETLEKNNRLHTETIIKHEQTVMHLKDECLQSYTKLSRAEVALANIQKENALLKDAERRLLKERETNRQRAHNENLMHTNIELIKATLERNKAESNMRLEARLDDAHRECAALRRRLQEEQDNFRELTEHLKKQAEIAQQRMEEEKQEAEKLRGEIVELRDDLVKKSGHIEDLTKKLKSSMVAMPDGDGEGRKFREMEQLLSDSQAECEMLKEKLRIAKETVEQHSNVAENAEKQLKEVFDLKEAAEAKIKEQEKAIARLQEQNSELQGELSVQNDGQESASTDLKTRIYRLEQELKHAKEDLKEATDALETAKNEIKTLSANVEETENKYSREMMLHSNDLQQLSVLKEELTRALTDINEVKNERDRALEAMRQNEASWNLQEDLFKKEKHELTDRFQNMEQQNALLLDEIQKLNTQLSVIQAQADSSMGESSFNRSFVEDEVKSSDQLLKIIKYLRQEKDIAVSKCEILEAEQQRLKTEHEALEKQFAEAKTALDAERQTSDVSVVTAAKHAEILRKVETLNAITDSNRALRQERDSLIAQVEQLKVKIVALEEKMAPLEEKNKELTLKAEAMQTENISLRGEATRWRQRANFLIEKSNRTSPEDWKKLQNERETLAKQLTIERGNVAKLTDENNNFRQDKNKLEDQLKSLRLQNNAQADEISRLKDSVSSLQTQVSSITQTLEQTKESLNKLGEDHRVLTEDTASKDVTINDLRNNLVQIRKIAKKYKTQCEDQVKEIESLKEQLEALKTAPENISEERREQLREEGRSELQQRLVEMEEAHKQKLEELSQQVASITGDNESCKKEIETLKQHNTEKEERFKTLFKNAKDKILNLTEQNNALKEQMNNSSSAAATTPGGSGDKSQGEGASDLAGEVERLQKENAEKQAEKDRLTTEIETLTQRVNQLQRQLGHQQGAKPTTSSGTTEKTSTEPPTANIKPMAGHSTNTQAQSVTVQPWRSGGEPPLASIRPMSMQVRTIAVLPTSQTPSAVMVPPQQQVHTTGSSSIEALSSSPTSSHTDYAPATSSANISLLGGPRQIVVPPTQSTADTEDLEDTTMPLQQQQQQQQQQQPQQAVAHVLPRVEPPSSGSGGFSQDQGTSSSSSSNTVTTTQASLKRQRDADADNSASDEQPGGKTQLLQQQAKRTRLQQQQQQQAAGSSTTEASQSVSESGCLEVEYQVPTSSQRDHEEEVIVVESDEGEGPDEGEGVDDEADDPDTEGYDMDLAYPHEQELNYEDADCQDEEDVEGGNEVEVIHDDSSEVPNQSERSVQGSSSTSHQVENIEQAQSEATSSGTDGSSGVTFSQASTSAACTTMASFSRTRPVAPHSRQQVLLLLPHVVEDGGDDSIVPSTPTLYVPRRSDGFGEAVSSPVVPTSGRFSFNESAAPSGGSGSNEVVPEQTLELANVDDNGTGRSVPTTPLRASPQEAGPAEETSHHQQSEEIPAVAVGEEAEAAPEGSSGECMGPPSVAAGTSSETTQTLEQSDDMIEGEDGVTSEGEKPVTAEENEEEEGREAEASPSTNTRTRSQSRSSHGVSRRARGGGHSMSSSSSSPRGGGAGRPSPTPIVWGEQRTTRHQQEAIAARGAMGRANTPPQHGYAQRTPRRGRGRAQRPYGRF